MGAKGRVLLVEDDDAVRSTTRAMLSRIGYEVVAVESMEAALDRLSAPEPFGLLMTDLVLPGGSGIELATAAQRLRPGVPVLFISGWLDHPAVVGLRSRFLPKPYGIAELQHAMRELVPAADPPAAPATVTALPARAEPSRWRSGAPRSLPGMVSRRRSRRPSDRG